MRSLSFDDSVRHVRSLLDSCEFDSALESARAIQGSDVRELRIVSHLVGKIAFRKGNYSSALLHFQNAELAYGEYIGLTCDIASAHYMLENFEAFESETRRAMSTLKRIRPHLSPETLARSSLSLSKFSEELGLIADAVDICETSLELVPHTVSGSLESIRLMMRAQLLRLHAQFNSPQEHIQKHYRALLQLSRTKHRLFQNVDVQHSLMIAESRLLGPQQALNRLKALLATADLTDASHNGEMNEADLRLCYFDLMAEGLALTGLPWADFPKVHFQHLTQFEHSVLALQNGSLPTWQTNGKKIPFGQRLTLLLLQVEGPSNRSAGAARKTTPLDTPEARQLDLLLSTLPRVDSELWRRRLTPNHRTVDEIQYDAKSGRLNFGATSLTLKGTTSKILFESLLEASTTSGGLGTSELSSLIWQENYTLAHYERLRVSSQRLNSSLGKLTRQSENVMFSKSVVKLNPALKFKRV